MTDPITVLHVDRIVDAHGWKVDVTGSAESGARLEITGISVGWASIAVSDLTAVTLPSPQH